MEQDFHHDDPQNWKWGVFYVNAQDDRLIVPERIRSLGWTLNFAHPLVWTGIVMIIVIIIFTKLYL